MTTRHGAVIEHMRTAFGEMDDAFHGILAGDVLATARRLAAMARAAERAGGAGLGRGDVARAAKGRCAWPRPWRCLSGAGGLVGHGLQQVSRVRHIDGVGVTFTARRALQVEQARTSFSASSPGRVFMVMSENPP